MEIHFEYQVSTDYKYTLQYSQLISGWHYYLRQYICYPIKSI